MDLPVVSDIFTKSFEVRWDDTDFNGHLRNTRYLEYAGTARMHHLMSMGWDVRMLRKVGFAPILLGDEISYRREVYLAERVDVSCEIVGLSSDRARWRMRHVVSREDGTAAAVAHCLCAWLDVETRRIAPPPAGLQEAMEAARAEDCVVIGSQYASSDSASGPVRASSEA
ncbi:thioesterase family protein [Streptomyces mirabilis]|uniref:acyl-CoA thioesterase n=1 Tax=Streptomyces mirabilis TaxID=68239 RepID=UPI0022551777|nr:thioesterase family protein [Streptomyces mirabilis]MCX5355748.1 thioesterase family protein [Streptomyces mirabilis]